MQSTSVYVISRYPDGRLLRENWHDANRTCDVTYGAQLLSLNTVAELQYFRTLSQQISPLWTSLICDTDTGELEGGCIKVHDDFFWGDGTPVKDTSSVYGSIALLFGWSLAVADGESRSGLKSKLVAETLSVVCEANDTCLNATCNDPNFPVCAYVQTSSPGPLQTRCQASACVSDPCTGVSTCIDQQGGYAYTCMCPDGFTGVLCDLEIDECLSNPCPNNSRCVDGLALYTCVCDSGYTGDRCDIPDCGCSDPQLSVCVFAPNPNGPLRYRCQRDADDDCSSDPCNNGSSCIDGFQGFEYGCLCSSGFTGVHCQSDIDECMSNPCNNGLCLDDVNFYTCSCYAGYTGVVCSVDTCSVHGCYGNGNCSTRPGSNTRCSCREGFDPQTNCQFELSTLPLLTSMTPPLTSNATIEEASSSSSASSTAYVIAGSFAALFALIVCLTLGSRKRVARSLRRRRSRHSVSSIRSNRSDDSLDGYSVQSAW